MFYTCYTCRDQLTARDFAVVASNGRFPSFEFENEWKKTKH